MGDPGVGVEILVISLEDAELQMVVEPVAVVVQTAASGGAEAPRIRLVIRTIYIRSTHECMNKWSHVSIREAEDNAWLDCENSAIAGRTQVARRRFC